MLCRKLSQKTFTIVVSKDPITFSYPVPEVLGRVPEKAVIFHRFCGFFLNILTIYLNQVEILPSSDFEQFYFTWFDTREYPKPETRKFGLPDNHPIPRVSKNILPDARLKYYPTNL